jgi:outer membrane protein TolC
MTFLRFAAVLGLAVGLASALTAEEAGPLLTLDEAIHQALAHNRAFKVVEYNRGIARANWLTALGQFDPNIVVNRSVSQSQSPIDQGAPVLDDIRTNTYQASLQGLAPWGLTYSIGGTANRQTDLYGDIVPGFSTFGGINITQPLLRGFGLGANLVGVRVARANRRISEWDFREAAINTVTSVVNAYINLAAAHDGQRIAHEFQDLANQFVTDDEKEFAIGAYAHSDVLQAEAQAAGRTESVLIADRSVIDAENQLRELIGQDAFPVDEPRYRLEDLGAPETLNVRPADDLRTALLQRPDYQAARLGLVVNRANDAAAQNGLLPQVDFVGGYGYNGLSNSFTAARQMVGNRENPSYSAGLQLTIPLTFAQARGKARAARLQMEQAEEGLRQLEADIALGLTTAAGQIETTRQRVAADRKAYDLAQQALDAEVKRLRAGKSQVFFVLNLQNSLAAAESSYSGALASERTAVANYYQQLGTTLQRYHISLDAN